MIDVFKLNYKPKIGYMGRFSKGLLYFPVTNSITSLSPPIIHNFTSLIVHPRGGAPDSHSGTLHVSLTACERVLYLIKSMSNCCYSIQMFSFFFFR